MPRAAKEGTSIPSVNSIYHEDYKKRALYSSQSNRFIIIDIPTMDATKVSLKLFIDKKSHRVLFAEAEKEFVDFLFSIFSLPVGAITRLMKEGGGMVGSLPGLYRSIENLSVTYIQPGKDKQFLLEPRVFMPGAKVPLLLPNVGSTFRQLYRCSNKEHNSRIVNCCSYVDEDDSTICCKCKNKMERNVWVVDPPSAIRAFFSSDAGYVDRTATYMVTDCLEVKVLSTNSFVTLFKEFNVDEIEAIEEKVVDLGMDEGVKLLRASLQSKTVLTDVFLPAEIIKSVDSIKNEEYQDIAIKSMSKMSVNN